MSNIIQLHMAASLSWFCCLLLCWTVISARNIPTDGRYSYSLSTFDTKGQLGQVQSALLASGEGTPIVAMATNQTILMAAPQALPSPFILQDGTPRFVQITKEIILTHSGVSADGRILVAAAQRLAIEHEYTFDEEIPVEIFLQELSLLYQEYTIKPAARPFGTGLLIGHNPVRRPTVSSSTTRNREPMLYRIDPTGTVSKNKGFVMNQVMEQSELSQTVSELLLEADHTEDSIMEKLVQALRASLQTRVRMTGIRSDTKEFDPLDGILCASLSNGRFRVAK
jgi:20S proteasome subunit alpha 2